MPTAKPTTAPAPHQEKDPEALGLKAAPSFSAQLQELEKSSATVVKDFDAGYAELERAIHTDSDNLVAHAVPLVQKLNERIAEHERLLVQVSQAFATEKARLIAQRDTIVKTSAEAVKAAHAAIEAAAQAV